MLAGDAHHRWSRPSQLSNQSQEIDFAPRLRDPAMMDPVYDELCELHGTVSRSDTFEVATVRRSSCCPQNHSITFRDQIINGVIRGRKCRRELPFEPLQFVPIHRSSAEVANVVGRKELVELAREA